MQPCGGSRQLVRQRTTSDTYLRHAGDVYQLPREMQDAAREVRAPLCQASPCILWSSKLHCTLAAFPSLQILLLAADLCPEARCRQE